jgi:hypothetical protein
MIPMRARMQMNEIAKIPRHLAGLKGLVRGGSNRRFGRNFNANTRCLKRFDGTPNVYVGAGTRTFACCAGLKPQSDKQDQIKLIDQQNGAS